MSRVTEPLWKRGTAQAPTPAGRPPQRAGVHGWLLVLCIMLTVVGPLISGWIVATEFNLRAADFVRSRETQWATIVSIALTTCSIAFGIYAGLRLWTIKPHAVDIARAALLFGLGVDVVTTVLWTALDTVSSTGDDVFDHALIRLVPSLLFFTICLGYLNKSARVEATYSTSVT